MGVALESNATVGRGSVAMTARHACTGVVFPVQGRFQLASEGCANCTRPSKGSRVSSAFHPSVSEANFWTSSMGMALCSECCLESVTRQGVDFGVGNRFHILLEFTSLASYLSNELSS